MLDFNLDIQKQLIFAMLDDFSPNDALPNSNGGQYGKSPSEWRAAVVNMICELVDLGLIQPNSSGDGYNNLTAGEIKQMLEEGDKINGLDVDLLWDAIHFSGTNKLKNILESAGLSDWSALNADLSPSLGRALAQLQS